MIVYVLNIEIKNDALANSEISDAVLNRTQDSTGSSSAGNKDDDLAK